MKPKTICSFLIAALCLPFLSAAQTELASAEGVAPYYTSADRSDLPGERGDVVVTVPSATSNGIALITLDRKLISSAVQLQVLTPASTMLYNQNLPADRSRVRLDLTGLPDGVYTVRIKIGEKMLVKQITKS